MTEPPRGGSDWRATVPVGTETVQTGSLILLTTVEFMTSRRDSPNRARRSARSGWAHSRLGVQSVGSARAADVLIGGGVGLTPPLGVQSVGSAGAADVLIGGAVGLTPPLGVQSVGSARAAMCSSAERLVDGSAGAGCAGRVTWRTPLVVARLPVEGSGRWPVGWVFELELAVGAANQLGTVLVDLFVVAVAAEQAEIVDVGRPSVLPVDHVVGLAEAVRGSADGTAPVSGREDDALRRVGMAVLVTQPEGLALGVEESREDVGVEGQTEEFAGRQRGAVGDAGVNQLLGDEVVVGVVNRTGSCGGSGVR